MSQVSDHFIDVPGLASEPQLRSIVAIDVAGRDRVELFRRRQDGSTERSIVPASPWLVTTESASKLARLTLEEARLDGQGELRILKRFSSSDLWSDAVRQLRSSNADHLVFPSRAEQYQIETGTTLFQGMAFDDVRRAQVDIETLGLNPADPDNAIIIITATLNGSDPFVVHGGDLREAELIDALNEWIAAADPDVIEGHNIFNFDLPFLLQRAHQHGMELRWGRDRSPVRTGNRQRFKAGARTIPYDAAYIRGRHVVDTYQQIQRYDVAGHFRSYGLKEAIQQLGLERHDRTHVAGADIAETWRSDPDRLVRYAVDDVLDTDLLSRLTLPTEFYQAQLLPSGLQSVATGGPGEKVNDLLVRGYVRSATSIPIPSTPHGYPGGFTAVRETGIFGPVVNADVESLYPSIMLVDGIAPASDELGIFLPMLRTLTDERIRAKRRAEQSEGASGARWHGTQLSLKVLINSFYGYLGYGRGYFNDFHAAEQVTRRGHSVIQQVESLLNRAKATVIEIDTDGIYFVPPADLSNDAGLIGRFVDDLSGEIDDGIRLSVDGIWDKMLSLKLKNYALLDSDGNLTVKGSSLRSRRDELYLRNFLQQAVLGYLDPDRYQEPREIYLDTARAIVGGQLDPSAIARLESITDRTFTSDANRRLARVARGERIGERITVYQRSDGELGRIEEYANDEDRSYLLNRLRSMAERFRPLYQSDTAFDHDFPAIGPGSDVDAIAAQEPVAQPSLFDL